MPHAHRTSAAVSAGVLTASNLATKVGSALLQIVMGIIFTPDQFALIAVFVGITVITNTLSGIGAQNEVMRNKLNWSSRSLPSLLWLSRISNYILMLVLVIAAVPLSRIYQLDELAPMLVILAISYPIRSATNVTGALIMVNISSTRFARIQIESELVRLLVSALLIYLLRSPIALALAMLFQTCWITLRIWTSFRAPSRIPFPVKEELLKAWRLTRWLVLGGFATTLLQVGDYAALGLVADPDLVGNYYFAYALPAQVGFIAVALGDTLMLHLTQNKGRERVISLSIQRLIALTGMFTVPLAVTFPSINTLLWQDKWTAAITATQIFCLIFPFRLTFSITRSLLVTRGGHRVWAIMTLLQGLGMVVVALLVGSLLQSVTAVALAIAAYMVTSSLIVLYIGAHIDQISLASVTSSIAKGWVPPICALLGSVLALWLLGRSGSYSPVAGILVPGVAGVVSAGLGLLIFDKDLLKKAIRLAKR